MKTGTLLVGVVAAGVLLAACTGRPPTTAPATLRAYPAITAADALAQVLPDHDDGSSVTWEFANTIPIDLTSPAEISGVRVTDHLIRVTRAGSYRVTGSLADGGLLIDTADSDPVLLVLDGAEITNPAGPAISIDRAALVVLVIAEGSENTLVDGARYEAEGEGAADSTVDSTANLTITGGGSLTVIGNHADAISVSAGLVIREATVNVRAVGDGVRARDYLVIDSGVLGITADGVGLRADNSADPGLGYIALGDPTIRVVAAGAAGLAAANAVIAAAPSLSVTTGGGSPSTGADDSANAVHGEALVVFDGGTVQLAAAGDGVVSSGTVAVNGGRWTIAAAGDAVRGELALLVTGGTITVDAATEGLAAETVTISGGTLEMVTAEHGINAGAAEQPAADRPSLTISGGSITVDALGNGIHSDGSITLAGGEVLVRGPLTDEGAAIAHADGLVITGGVLVAADNARTAQTPSADSPRRSLVAEVTGTAGTVVEFVDGTGRVIAGFTGTRKFANVVVSTPAIEADQTYTIVVDGKAAGTTTSEDAANQTPTRPR